MTTTISFDEDVRLMREFSKLLEREQESLIANNAAEIEEVVSVKASLLQQINETAKKRYAKLVALHFEANENGMVAWVINQADPQVKKRWESFQQLLMKSKETNRLNGLLITKHFNRNRQILQGLQNAFKSDEVYGRNGHTSTTATIRNGVTA